MSAIALFEPQMKRLPASRLVPCVDPLSGDPDSLFRDLERLLRDSDPPAGYSRPPCRYSAPLVDMGVPTVSDLDAEFQRGEATALRRAYDEHAALVHTFCRRSFGGDSAAAEDLTQEIFLAAWRAHERFDPQRGSLRAWLMGIARNKVIDRYRHQERRPRIADDDITAVEPGPGAGPTAIDAMADRMLLASALDELPERARRVVELAFFQQFSHGEIVEATGLPLGTVKSDIRRGLSRMRRHLEGVS